MTTTMGMPSSIPQAPQSQDQKSIDTNTAVAFILAMRSLIQVVTKTPMMVAIVIDAPAT